MKSLLKLKHSVAEAGVLPSFSQSIGIILLFVAFGYVSLIRYHLRILC
jgi:hypothetical protein